MVRFSRYAPPVEFKPGSARAAKLTQSPQRGQALFLIQDKPATIFTIAKTGAMLFVGQICSRETTALAVEPSCGSDSIDLCINNAIIGVQEQNTYAQTEGECRPARRSA